MLARDEQRMFELFADLAKHRAAVVEHTIDMNVTKR
jgi:hypothetical protein